MARFGRDGAFQRLPCHEGGIVVAGGSRRSAAPRPRALGRFVDTGWQDSRAVHDSRGPFPVPGPFWDTWSAKLAKDCHPGTHRGKILPRIVAWERIARAYCHCRMPGNAFCEHFAIGERPQRHSAMYRNVMHRSATDARVECPAPRLPLGQRRRTLPLMPHVPDAHTPAPPAAALRRHASYAALLPPLKK